MRETRSEHGETARFPSVVGPKKKVLCPQSLGTENRGILANVVQGGSPAPNRYPRIWDRARPVGLTGTAVQPLGHRRVNPQHSSNRFSDPFSSKRCSTHLACSRSLDLFSTPPETQPARKLLTSSPPWIFVCSHHPRNLEIRICKISARAFCVWYGRTPKISSPLSRLDRDAPIPNPSKTPRAGDNHTVVPTYALPIRSPTAAPSSRLEEWRVGCVATSNTVRSLGCKQSKRLHIFERSERILKVLRGHTPGGQA